MAGCCPLIKKSETNLTLNFKKRHQEVILVEVNFRIIAYTSTDECVYLTGSADEIGKWDARKPVQLHTTATTYPEYDQKEKMGKKQERMRFSLEKPLKVHIYDYFFLSLFFFIGSLFIVFLYNLFKDKSIVSIF